MRDSKHSVLKDVLSKVDAFLDSSVHSESLVLSGLIADLDREEFFEGKVYVDKGVVARIERCPVLERQFIIPGLIDSHIHIESSMLVPSEFAREAVRHGMVAAVADPHEIANVCGVEGVQFMLDNGQASGYKFFFAAPSCVPAAPFDIAGAELGVEEVKQLLSDSRVTHLGEMMNFPGVINDVSDILAKLDLAKQLGKPIDGHAPGLTGDDLKKYVGAGITTDHEAVDICEAEEKISLGMKILIREGSAAKSFDNLYPLVNRYPSQVMFCSDDCHPDDLMKGSINLLIKRGLKNGLNIFNLLRAASKNPVEHYGLNVGLLREGDPADIVVVDDLTNFNILKTYIDGQLVFSAPSHVELPKVAVESINQFNAFPITLDSIAVAAEEGKRIRVIEVIDRDLYTRTLVEEPTIIDGKVAIDVDRDLLKIVVLNRYKNLPPAVGFVKKIGLKRGAICSSVSHDSHNIIAIGADDKSIVELVNMVIDSGGGIGVHDGYSASAFSLPIGGIMSKTNAESAASAYEFVQQKAKSLGTELTAPFMTMSFLSLIVIPQLKLSSVGLFDVDEFKPVSLFV